MENKKVTKEPLNKAEFLQLSHKERLNFIQSKGNKCKQPIKEDEIKNTCIVEDWEKDIIQLEDFFNNIEIPNKSIQLSKAEKITDCRNFIKSHIATIKANNGKQTFIPYLNRLHLLQKLLIDL